MASNFHHQGLQCISLVLQYFWRSVPDPTSQAGSKLKLLQRLFYSSWYLQAETSSPCASTCILRIHDKIQNFRVKNLEIISVISYKAWGSWWRVATSCTYIALYGAFVRVMDKTLTPQSLTLCQWQNQYLIRAFPKYPLLALILWKKFTSLLVRSNFQLFGKLSRRCGSRVWLKTTHCCCNKCKCIS